MWFEELRISLYLITDLKENAPNTFNDKSGLWGFSTSLLHLRLLDFRHQYILSRNIISDLPILDLERRMREKTE